MSAHPLTIMANGHLLVDTDHPQARPCINALQSCSRITAYTGRYVRARLDRTSLWNAAAAGFRSDDVVGTLTQWSGALDERVRRTITTLMERWGALVLTGQPDALVLAVNDPLGALVLLRDERLHAVFAQELSPGTYRIDATQRGLIKQLLVQRGWPIIDNAGTRQGTALDIAWNDRITLYPYQQQAVDAALASSHGVLVLPPGSGKTYIGVALVAALCQHALIVTSSRAAAQQWHDSVARATTVEPTALAIYRRQATLAPLTITTYQQLIRAPQSLLDAEWGVIVYDEVHTLPAPVFRTTAAVQSRRRYGLSATLIREDGHITDVYSLVGPQRYTVPWRTLEQAGYIAPVQCIAVTVDHTPAERAQYLAAFPRQYGRIAAMASAKLTVLQRLAQRHQDASILVIGQYLEQLQQAATVTGWPLLTGNTPEDERQALYDAFRSGRAARLIISKVGNQAIDLPNASVLIQLSGAYGSRQEEAQRLGRVLRVHHGEAAFFYSLMTTNTREIEDNFQRQRFLVAQGYRYRTQDGASL
ncbi:MAG: hypothetical protein RLY87_887 [Chloroflexota bacterium]